MLTLISPTSQLHFTSLSPSSIPPLQKYLSSHPSSSRAYLHTNPILSLLSSSTPPISKNRVCLLDPKAPLPLDPEDDEEFDYFLYGGILGDDPPRDRTAELRKLGFEGRHLGAVQMTTDTAVGVTKLVVEDKGGLVYTKQVELMWSVPLDQISYTVGLAIVGPLFVC